MVDGHVGFVHWLTHGGAKRGLFVSYLTERGARSHHAASSKARV